MRDRFIRGLLAGIVAGVVPFIFNFGSKLVNISTLTWSDFLSLYILGRELEGLGERLFAIVMQFFLLGLLGIIFVYLVPLLSSRYYWVKGAVYGASIWLISFGATTIFRFPELQEIPLRTAISNLIGGILWGLALVFVLNWLDDRLKV